LFDFVSLPFKPGTDNNEWAEMKGSKEQWDAALQTAEMKGYNRLVRKCYRVLRQMCKGNVHNGHTIAQKGKISMTNSCRLVSKIGLGAGYEWDIPSSLEMMFRENGALLKDISTVLVLMDAHLHSRMLLDPMIALNAA
jgi:hypothetical protein